MISNNEFREATATVKVALNTLKEKLKAKGWDKATVYAFSHNEPGTITVTGLPSEMPGEFDGFDLALAFVEACDTAAEHDVRKAAIEKLRAAPMHVVQALDQTLDGARDDVLITGRFSDVQINTGEAGPFRPNGVR